jgi:putative RecB family exonuclease
VTNAADVRFSYSRLSTFADCPRRYEFRYVARRREAFDSVEAVLGRAVHETLAWLYTEREGGESPGEANALEHFTNGFRAALGPSVRVIRQGDSFERHEDLGRSMIAAHHQDGFARDALRSLGIEERFDLPLDGGWRFTGVIDRRAVDRDGALHLVDYKTTGRPPETLGPEDDFQLRSYGMACMALHGIERVTLHYLFLRNGRTFSSTMESSDGLATGTQLVERIERTAGAQTFPPNPSALCAWCGFREDCDVSGFSGTGTTCPRCGGTLRSRRGRFGDFLGCTNYPRCRYTRDA